MSSVPKTKIEMNPLGSGGLMTGTKMWGQAILESEDSSDFTFGIRVFDTGERTQVRTHTVDQILTITKRTPGERCSPSRRNSCSHSPG